MNTRLKIIAYHLAWFVAGSSLVTIIVLFQAGYLVKEIHAKLQHITHAQTRTGTLRVFRTLASHHLVPVITALLEFPLPYDQ